MWIPLKIIIHIGEVDSPENHEVSLEAARKSLVLLRNQDNVLPLDRSKVRRIAVCGPNADAKKHKSSNVDGKVYTAVVHSYTHGTDYTIVVSSDYLGENDRVLLVDDFLANGKALVGLTELVRQAGGTVVGAAIAIEKGFQGGGDALRAEGVRVESLAIVDSMTDDAITFRN